VGNETTLKQGEDLDYPGLGRRDHEGLHAFGANDGAGKSYAFDARDEVSQAGGGLELELARQPLAFPDERLEVPLSALATE
jgi:hypothetical protein